MRTLVIGAGPAGLMLGATLARRGHDVTCVDRDPGPAGEGWPRRGVMQFRHAHNFRGQVPTFLRAEWPEADHAWLALGAEPLEGDLRVLGYFSRRETFERALRVAAADQPGPVAAHGPRRRPPRRRGPGARCAGRRGGCRGRPRGRRHRPVGAGRS